MSLRVCITVCAVAVIGYSAAPLLASPQPESNGQCCSGDGQCGTGYHCDSRPGDDCSPQQRGYCTPIPTLLPLTTD